MLWMCKYFFFKLFLNLLSLALCYMEMFHLNKWLHKSRSRLWPCWLRSHFSFIGTALKQCRARVPVWPVLYNLRLRQINKGPPLSSRSAQRPVCQQSSSTQLVPNRRGWHTDIHSQTQTHTHINDTVIQHGPRHGCPVKVLADGNTQFRDQTVGHISGLNQGKHMQQTGCVCFSSLRRPCLCLSVDVCVFLTVLHQFVSISTSLF